MKLQTIRRGQDGIRQFSILLPGFPNTSLEELRLNASDMATGLQRQQDLTYRVSVGRVRDRDSPPFVLISGSIGPKNSGNAMDMLIETAMDIAQTLPAHIAPVGQSIGRKILVRLGDECAELGAPDTVQNS